MEDDHQYGGSGVFLCMDRQSDQNSSEEYSTRDQKDTGDTDSEPPALGDCSNLSDYHKSDKDSMDPFIGPNGLDSDTEDPQLTVSHLELFDNISDEDLDDPKFLNCLVPAFFEYTSICNMYIVTQLLEESTSGLVIPRLDNMAMTLLTVDCQLGLDPDVYIQYFSGVTSAGLDITPLNYTRYTLNSEADSWNPLHQVLVKIFPYAPLIPAIQRILHQPGKYESLQHWYKEGSKLGQAPPLHAEGYKAFSLVNARIDDVYDAWGSRALQAGLIHRKGGKWGVEDVDIHEIN
ncbi:hypothetical protein K439DRAFT_1612076 [Ramaria rubella]|nr:hypothetical protein K439DRAFT_1612076 [Ramaria rubella]